MVEIEELLASEWHRLVENAPPDGASPLSLPPERRVPLRPVALFAQLEEVREDWRTLTSDMSADELSRYINGAWTLKELLAHVASWAREFRHEVETVFRGGDFDYAIPFVMTVMGPNAWNEKEVQARHERSFEEIVQEFEKETRHLQELLFEMSEQDLYGLSEFPLAPSGDPKARWRGPSAVIIYGKCAHDRHHLEQIRTKLAAWRLN
jgi:hypothetical protein